MSYDDGWIIDNWQKYRNWLRLCNAYNEAHGTDIGYSTFKSHCNRECRLNYHYTDEQKQWLVDNYPHMGRVKCAKEFNRIFGETRTPQAIKVECKKLGLCVTNSRKKERAIENTGRYHEIGTVIRGSHGEDYVKTESGWKRVKDVVYGNKPDDCILVHLDNDVTNNDAENIRAISRSVNARMTANKFWSKDPNITKAGILCCELDELLKEESYGTDTGKISAY